MNKKYLLMTLIYLVIIIPLLIKTTATNEEEVIENYMLPEVIIIELTGEVVYPGIYSFYEPVNLDVVIGYAGGLTSSADSSKINYYESIKQSKTIKVLGKKNDENNNDTLLQLIDLNDVSFSELISFDFITETRAANIIIYRTQNGRFNSVEELINVKGIGSVTFESIAKYFKV